MEACGLIPPQGGLDLQWGLHLLDLGKIFQTLLHFCQPFGSFDSEALQPAEACCIQSVDPHLAEELGIDKS